MSMKVSAVIILSFFLSSCVIKDDLPSQWGPLNSKCSDVTILLNNMGLSSSDYGENKLSKLLVPNAEFGYRAEQIKVRAFTELNRLDIELVYDSKTVETLTLNTEEFKGCENGGYVVARSAVSNSGGALGKEWWEFKLYFTPDYLIISKKKGVVGTLFFVPMAGTETQWLRFDKA
jgi:hypothetical protein